MSPEDLGGEGGEEGICCHGPGGLSTGVVTQFSFPATTFCVPRLKPSNGFHPPGISPNPLPWCQGPCELPSAYRF